MDGFLFREGSDGTRARRRATGNGGETGLDAVGCEALGLVQLIFPRVPVLQACPFRLSDGFDRRFQETCCRRTLIVAAAGDPETIELLRDLVDRPAGTDLAEAAKADH